MFIHPTAVVADGARIAQGVNVGPYCIVGPQVALEEGVVLHAHVVVDSDTVIGANTQVYPFASLGAWAQDKKMSKEQAARMKLRIGRNNVIREHVTIHPGTPGGRGITEVGSDGFFQVGSHIAHDCLIGNQVIFTNLAAIAGHVTIEDKAVLGAMVGVHQFARVGTLAMLAAGAMCSQDVPPYCMVQGDRGRLIGLNQVGLRRAGVPIESYVKLRDTFRRLFWHGHTLATGLEEVESLHGGDAYVARMVAFVRQSKRGVCAARRASFRNEPEHEAGMESAG
jgi:UDP-N-acetylglucosamine acyltransferase